MSPLGISIEGGEVTIRASRLKFKSIAVSAASPPRLLSAGLGGESMKNSSIEWTHHTFNPWIGCTQVSPACDHCYAMTMMDHRYHRVEWGAGKLRVRTSREYWRQPLRRHRDALAQGIRERVFLRFARRCL